MGGDYFFSFLLCIVQFGFHCGKPNFIRLIVVRWAAYEISTYNHFLYLQIKSLLQLYEILTQLAITCSFFYPAFLSRIFTIHRKAEEGGGCLFNSSPLLPPTLQTLTQTLARRLLQDAHLRISLRKSLTTILCPLSCSTITMETIEQGVKYVQSNNKDTISCLYC